MTDKIPIRNIYYMLCYAWEDLERAQVETFDQDSNTELVNLFARVFLQNVADLNRRGPHRDYKSQQEDDRVIRGKLKITDTVKRGLLWNGKVAVETSELTVDTSINQVIKATALSLLGVDCLDCDLALQLRILVDSMAEVSLLRLSNRVFYGIRFNSLTRNYKPTMSMCELIYNQLIPLEKEGQYHFQEFTRDRKQMASVFENFVRNFYRAKFPNFKVGSRRLNWSVEATEEDRAFLPAQFTDTSIEMPNKSIIIDTKYYQETLRTSQYKESVDSGNLYQMAAYLQNSKLAGSRNICGVLLYPQVSEGLNLRYKVWGIPLTVKTVDLTQPWKNIEDDLVTLLEVA